MLKGSNTTISIAHRLSTIQRSDRIICIGADGRVAQTGPYRELAADKNGAFAKLMEWQMNGGQSTAAGSTGKDREDVRPEITEEEKMVESLQSEDVQRGETKG